MKLVLQPLLENAINYGVGSMEDCGEITVIGREEEGNIILSVRDNGLGMPEEEVESLLTDHDRVHAHGSGVGLVNVNNRLQILFGKGYGLTVESEPDEGTTVSICIPAMEYTEENRKLLEKGYSFSEEKNIRGDAKLLKMNKSKRIFVIMELVLPGLVIMMAFIIFRERSGKALGKISVIIQDSDDNRWSAFKYGLKMAAQDQGAEMFVVSAGKNLTPEEQMEMVNSEIDHGADAVIVQPAPGTDTKKLRKGLNKRVPVMLVGCSASKSSPPMIGPDNYAMGQSLAKELLNDYNGSLEGKTVGIMAETAGSTAAAGRAEGFKEAMEGSGAKISWCVTNSFGEGEANSLEGEPGHQDAIIRTENAVDTLKNQGIGLEKLNCGIANWNRAQAQNRMMQMIGQYQNKIELVLANNDDMALGAIDAYKKLNFTESARPVFFGIDGTDVGLRAVVDLELSGTVYNDKEGQAEAMAKLAAGLVLDEGMKGLKFKNERYVFLPYEKITAENVREYQK